MSINRILIYKRTHVGDPDSSGAFGIHDCMGRIRDGEYDAVIGVGGMGPEAVSAGIAGRLTWIGIGPHKSVGKGRGPIVTFERFKIWDVKGSLLSEVAPRLAKRLYEKNVRILLHGMTDAEFAEAKDLLRLAQRSSPSPALLNKPSRKASTCKSPLYPAAH